MELVDILGTGACLLIIGAIVANLWLVKHKYGPVLFFLMNIGGGVLFFTAGILLDFLPMIVLESFFVSLNFWGLYKAAFPSSNIKQDPTTPNLKPIPSEYVVVFGTAWDEGCAELVYENLTRSPVMLVGFPLSTVDLDWIKIAQTNHHDLHHIMVEDQDLSVLTTDDRVDRDKAFQAVNDGVVTVDVDLQPAAPEWILWRVETLGHAELVEILTCCSSVTCALGAFGYVLTHPQFQRALVCVESPPEVTSIGHGCVEAGEVTITLVRLCPH